jgi:uncharacterized membrane protein YdjX (TVP38/TMEM64 family)
MIVILIATAIGITIAFATGFWAGRLTERFSKKRKGKENELQAG